MCFKCSHEAKRCPVCTVSSSFFASKCLCVFDVFCAGSNNKQYVYHLRVRANFCDTYHLLGFDDSFKTG